jgi:hypothetical protein
MIDVSDLVREAVERLRRSGVNLEPGLREAEIARIEETFGFGFGSEHREFLSAALPTGDSWMGWSDAPSTVLQGRLDWPIEGVIFDVRENGFWPASWGDRPEDRRIAEQQAREHLAQVPKLIPIYSHRCLPTDPAPVPSPVFSVHQTDVIYYGDNLLDYVAHEFNTPPLHPATPGERPHLPFWSDLAEGADNADL